MKRLLENSCMKGCTVYAIALLIVLVVSAFGLSGLSAGLGGGGEAAQSPGQGASVEQAASDAAGNQQGAVESSRITIEVGQPEPAEAQATPTPVPAQIQPQPQVQPEQEPAPPAQGGAPEPPEITGVIIAPQPQAQAHAPDISGETTSPFYIVQPGDTLFGIALKFETTVEALRAANNLQAGDNLIYSGNVIYLPAATPPGPQGQAPAPIPVEPQAPPLQPSENAVPTMPRTGIITTP